MADFARAVTGLYNSAGFAGTTALMSIGLLGFMVVSMGRRMKALTDAILVLTEKVSAPYLNADEAIELFHIVMENHVAEKMKLVRDILERNDIYNRRAQIEENLTYRFQQITNRECAIMSKYKTACGDMGVFVSKAIKWKALMDKVFTIVFSENDIPQKMIDLESYLDSEVEKLSRELKEIGVHN